MGLAGRTFPCAAGAVLAVQAHRGFANGSIHSLVGAIFFPVERRCHAFFGSPPSTKGAQLCRPKP